MNASSERDIDAAFASFVQQRVNAIILGVDQFLLNRRNQLVELKRSAYLLTDRQAPPFVHLKIRKIWFGFGQKGLDPMLELGIGPQFLEGLAFQLEAHAQRSFIG